MWTSSDQQLRGLGAVLTVRFPCHRPAEPRAAFTTQSRVAKVGFHSLFCYCYRETDMACECEQHHKVEKTRALPLSVIEELQPARGSASSSGFPQLKQRVRRESPELPSASTEEGWTDMLERWAFKPVHRTRAGNPVPIPEAVAQPHMLSDSKLLLSLRMPVFSRMSTDVSAGLFRAGVRHSASLPSRTESQCYTLITVKKHVLNG